MSDLMAARMAIALYDDSRGRRRTMRWALPLLIVTAR
jgi:hypothetical protein